MAIAELRAGAEIEGVFACSRKDRLTARNGTTYLAVELRDRSGAIPARAFRDADFLSGQFERGDLVRASGRVDRFRDELQVELRSIRRVEEGAADPADFLPVAYRDVAELDGFLEHLAREVYDPDYRRLLDAFLGDAGFRDELRRAPCTRAGHHAYLGGLLEHTVAVATLAQESCVLHPRLNSDLLLTAAVLHDIGKTREFQYGAEIALSDEGALVGHLALGQAMIAERAAGVPREKVLALTHCVLGHHGPDGLPGRRFRSPEALALYRLNALDAAVKGALEHGLPGLNVRLAEAGDFNAVTALLEQLGRPEVTEQTRDACHSLFEQQLADGETAHLVAEDDGEVIGFCSLHFRGRLNYTTPDAWVPDLIVAEHARRRGVARALLTEAERRARSRGCWVFTLESAHFRTEAHRLYEGFGMENDALAFVKPLR